MPAGPVTVTRRAARSPSARASAPATSASSRHAPHEGGVGRPRLERRGRAEPDQPPRLDRGRAALELDDAERLGPQAGTGEPARAVAEHDLAVGRECLQPGSDVQHIAGGERLAPRAGGHVHLARVDAGPHGDAAPRVCCSSSAPSAATRSHNSAAARTARSASSSCRRSSPEDADRGVALETLHRAAVALDHLGTDRRAAVEQRVQRLGVEPLGQRCRARDLRDHDADQPPPPARLRLRGARRGRGCRRRRRGRVELGRLLEHQPLQPPQSLAWLEAQLVGEEGARVAVEREPVGLAPRAVEREHQVAAQAFAQRVRRHELLQLGDELGVAADREVGLHAPLEHGQPLLPERVGLVAGQTLELDSLQRLAAPQRERNLGRREPLHRRGESLEFVGVELDSGVRT